jgi:hypothetical protein
VVQENLQRQESTTNVVLGHQVYVGVVGSIPEKVEPFTTIISQKRSMVVKHRSSSGLHRPKGFHLRVIEETKVSNI